VVATTTNNINTLQTAHENSRVCVSSIQTDHKNSCFSTFRLYTSYAVLTSHRGQFTAQLFSQMFIQVLGIMILLVIMSHSKGRPSVLLHSQTIFRHSTASHTSSKVTSSILMEDVILPELLSDNLSYVPKKLL
jgi:hypothetical protein